MCRLPSGERRLQASRPCLGRRIVQHRGGGAAGRAVCGRASSDNLTGSAKGSLGKALMDSNPLPRPPSYDKKIGLVLQGGGALGSYQAGVYQALASAEYLPDWVAGISIGAINSAIIAGNAPENRLRCLRSFWQGITAHSSLWPSALVGSPALWQQKASALTALLCGQPGFFTPRTLEYWFSSDKFISYYDT